MEFLPPARPKLRVVLKDPDAPLFPRFVCELCNHEKEGNQFLRKLPPLCMQCLDAPAGKRRWRYRSELSWNENSFFSDAAALVARLEVES